MNSCLYECEMRHARLAPVQHRFGYRIFLFALDLDELEELDQGIAPLSVNARNLYSFCERDYLPTGAGADEARPLTLKARVTACAAEQGVDLSGGRVVLVTLPRVAGYLFNPVSFYFCYDRTGAPAAAIAEVTNTFKEMKPYFIPLDLTDCTRRRFRLRVPKYFYVSPFSDVDVEFDFDLSEIGERLSIQIDDYTQGRRTFFSSLRGERRALTGARLTWYAIKYPLITLRIISLIHWHAFQLWLKRVPWFAKAARRSDQRQLYRPHSSLRLTPKLATAPTLSTREPATKIS